MKTFVQLRKMLSDHRELSRRLDELEKKYDSQFKVVFDALRRVLYPSPKKKRQIGFRMGEKKVLYKAKKIKLNKHVKNHVAQYAMALKASISRSKSLTNLKPEA